MRSKSIQILKDTVKQLEQLTKAEKNNVNGNTSKITNERKFLATFVNTVQAYCRGKIHMHTYGKRYYQPEYRMYFDTVEEARVFIDLVLEMTDPETKFNGNSGVLLNEYASDMGNDDPVCFYANTLFTQEIRDAVIELIRETPQEFQARRASEHAQWLTEHNETAHEVQMVYNR